MKDTVNATPTTEEGIVPPPVPGPMPLAWLKPEQVAELLQVSVRFVQELIRLGEIPAYAIGESGKVKRVYYNDLMDYMAEHRTPAPAETH